MIEISEATHRLILILEQQQPLLRSLIEGMQRERSSFVAARPSILERVEEQLLPTAERIAALEAERKEIGDQIQAVLGLKGELTASLLASHLEKPLADKLVATVERSTELAKTLAVEQAVGGQLLNFSHHAQESMYRDLMGLQDNNHAPGYDRCAKTLTESPGSGQLISGLI